MIVQKKVRLTLVGLDGNAFVLLGAFSRQAQKEGWTRKEIDAVCQEAMSGKYDHLLATLAAHCDADEQDDEDEQEGDADAVQGHR